MGCVMSKKKAPVIIPLTPRVLNVEATAIYIGVSVSKFWQLRKLGIFNVAPLPYGDYFDIRSVDNWIDEIGGIENAEKQCQQAWLEAAHG